MAVASARPGIGGLAWGRWYQLAWGIVLMVTIANLQYGWTLFINPINEKHQWGIAAIQVTFSISILTETLVGAPVPPPARLCPASRPTR